MINKIQKMSEPELLELVTNDSKLETFNDYLWFILIQASKLNCKKVVEILLTKENIDILKKDSTGKTAFSWAHQKGNKDILGLLFDYSINVELTDNYKNSLLQLACKHGRLDIVKFLVEEKQTNIHLMDTFGNAPLIRACYNGHLDIAKFLVKNGADIDTKNKNDVTPLIMTCYSGHLDIAKFLVENGANINAIDKDNNTPLLATCFCEHLNIAKSLVGNGTDIDTKNKNDDTPLLAARFSEHLNIAKFLVENGANINVKNKNDDTPLLAACLAGHLDIVEFLVKNGADTEARNDLNATPFLVACYRGYLDIAKFLVKNGSDINTTGMYNGTSLSVACFSGDLATAKFLVENGANINATDIDNNTPLHTACIEEHLTIVKLLLENGADMEAKNKDNLTALQLALTTGNTAIVDFIRDHVTKKLVVTLRENHEDKDTANKLIKYLNPLLTPQDSDVISILKPLLTPQNRDVINILNPLLMPHRDVINILNPLLIPQDSDVINILNALDNTNFKFVIKELFTRVNNMLSNPDTRTQFSEELLAKICRNTDLANFNDDTKRLLQLSNLKHLLINNNNNGKPPATIITCLKSINLEQLTNDELLDLLNFADNHKSSYVLTYILSSNNIRNKINDILNDMLSNDSTMISLSENILDKMCTNINFSNFDNTSRTFLETRKLKIACQKTNLPRGFDNLLSNINISDELLQEILATSSDNALKKILGKLNLSQLGSNNLGFDDINDILENMDPNRLNTIVTSIRRSINTSALQSEFLRNLIDEQEKIDEQNKIKNIDNGNNKKMSSVNDNNDISLINAVINDNIKDVKLLIHEEDINKQHPDNGKTALMYAIEKGNDKIISLLLAEYKNDNQNDITITDDKDRNHLVYAIKNRRVNAAMSLISNHNIKFDAYDQDEKYVLMYALEQGAAMDKVINALKSTYDNAAIDIKIKLFLSACTGGCENYIKQYADKIKNNTEIMNDIAKINSIFDKAFNIVKNSKDLLVFLKDYCRKNNINYDYKKFSENSTPTKDKAKNSPHKKSTKNVSENSTRTKVKPKNVSSKKSTKNKGRRKG